MKDSLFERILPESHPNTIIEIDEACNEIMDSIQSAILKEIDVSLPTIIALGGMESYLIAEAFRKTSLPFSCITVSPKNSAMKYYLSKHYNAGNAPNGITPDRVIEELNGSIISVKPESIYDNFDKASATNKGEDLSARTELKMAAFMQIIQESYIQGKQIFGVNQFNVLYGGYAREIASDVTPYQLNSYIEYEKDNSGSLYNIAEMSLLALDRGKRGKLENGIELINPFLNYDFYRACSYISSEVKGAEYFQGQRSILELCYLKAIKSRGINISLDMYELRKLIPRKLDVDETLCVVENILYSSRRKGISKIK